MHTICFRLFMFISLISTMISCRKEVIKAKSFPTFKEGIYYYDAYVGDSVYRDASVMTITHKTDSNNVAHYYFDERSSYYIDGIPSYSGYFYFAHYEFVKNSGGLYAAIEIPCPGFLVFTSPFYFLFFPNTDAVSDKAFRIYNCNKEISGENKILNQDTVISVEGKSYTAYQMNIHSRLSGPAYAPAYAFINKEVGIVQYELHNLKSVHDKLVLKLNRVE